MPVRPRIPQITRMLRTLCPAQSFCPMPYFVAGAFPTLPFLQPPQANLVEEMTGQAKVPKSWGCSS